MAWCAAMRIMARVEDLVQRTGDGRTCRVLGGRAIERSGGAVCDLYRAHGDEKHEFFIEPQNQGGRFVSGLASNLLGRFVSSLASKPLRRFVSDLASKPLGRFSLV
jgi:hypothetical protein